MTTRSAFRQAWAAVMLALLCIEPAVAGSAGTAPYFVKKATWFETVMVSREALAQHEADAEQQAQAARQSDPAIKAFKPFMAEVSGADVPRKIRARIAGLKKLYIGSRGARALWGNPQLLDSTGAAKPLRIDKAERFQWPKGGSLRQDEKPARIDCSFTSNLQSREAEVCVLLDGTTEWLETWIACSDKNEKQPVRLWADWRSVYEREVRYVGAAEKIWEWAGAEFPGPAMLRGQRLEELAGIWKTPWRTGDFAALAARYANACEGAAKARALMMAKGCASMADVLAVRDIFYLRHAKARLELAERTLAFVERSAPRPDMAAELKALQARLSEALEGKALPEQFYLQACELRRKIILSHPLLDFPKLLINKRSGALPEHMCDQYLGRHSRAAPGLVVLDNWKDGPKETVLLEGKLPPGGLIHPDLSYDATRVLFAYAEHTKEKQGQMRGYFIYEYSFETGQVRQITGTERDPLVGALGRATVFIEDTNPCYLPDGGFAFISTRSQQFGRCHGGRYVPSYTLHRGELDGSRIRPLSFNESNEWGPSVLNDGSIVYCRWDYVNRNDTQFQSLWVIHPDGTQTAHYYGNNSRAPCLIGEPQQIPNSHKTVSTAAAHHGQTLGTLIVVDPYRGQDGGEPLTWITPEFAFPESGVPKGTTVTPMPMMEDTQPSGRAATPWPLSEDLFLCTYQCGALHAICLIDTLGGRELIYRDPAISCFDPIPLRPRPMPPPLCSSVPGNESEKTGVFVIQDVYRSSEPIPRGSLKSLRVNQIISQPTSSVPPRSYVSNEVVKKVLGTVPVDEQGSVAFEAPASVPLQFQLLDGNGMAVMTMRSLVYVQPGERAACAGCHEPRSAAPPLATAGGTSAVQIHQLRPPAGPRYEGGFSFMRTVQPVLDRYCICCHGLDKAEGIVNLLGSRGAVEQEKARNKRVSSFASASYDALIGLPNMVVLAHRNSEKVPSRPKDYFAHAGKLAALLLAGHPDKTGKKLVEFDRESFQRIVDWLDLNAQCYGDYSFNRDEDRQPAPDGEKALRAAIEQRFGAELARQPFAALVNVAQPDESRVLLAPLRSEAGGWGQIAKGAFASKSDPAWQELHSLVERSIAPLRCRDIAGTCGRDQGCVCGGCWVRKAREMSKK